MCFHAFFTNISITSRHILGSNGHLLEPIKSYNVAYINKTLFPEYVFFLTPGFIYDSENHSCIYLKT